MHGDINLKSEFGLGTTTTFWIPFNKPRSSTLGSPLRDARPVPGSFRSDTSIPGCLSDAHSVDGDLQQNVAPPDHLNGRTGTGLGPMPPGEDPNEESVQREIDRGHVHVLVVEDKYVVISISRVLYRVHESICLLACYSAINQQIALKTVSKFGFSVNAVWNGKEALDYLLEAPSTTHPKPDIILMDCQMPVLDGYRTTHLIRHHSPYSAIASIRTLPIVAMTASAIQGDKEKCTQAGMVCSFGSTSRRGVPSLTRQSGSQDLHREEEPYSVP